MPVPEVLWVHPTAGLGRMPHTAAVRSLSVLFNPSLDSDFVHASRDTAVGSAVLPARAKPRGWLVGIVDSMTDAEPSQGALWRYQFSQPDETVVETGEFNGDVTAEARARELSTSKASPIVVKRHSAYVDAWVYVTEVDRRP